MTIRYIAVVFSSACDVAVMFAAKMEGDKFFSSGKCFERLAIFSLLNINFRILHGKAVTMQVLYCMEN